MAAEGWAGHKQTAAGAASSGAPHGAAALPCRESSLPRGSAGCEQGASSHSHPVIPHRAAAAAAPPSARIPRGSRLVTRHCHPVPWEQPKPLLNPSPAPPSKEEPGLSTAGSGRGEFYPKEPSPWLCCSPGPALSTLGTAGGSQHCISQQQLQDIPWGCRMSHSPALGLQGPCDSAPGMGTHPWHKTSISLVE